MEIFDLLSKIEDSLQGVSCLPKEPFMKLGQGQAPILNYSLEQKSAFSSYGHFQVDIEDNKFKANANAVPPNNIFDQVEGMTFEQIRQELRHDIRRGDRRILRTVGGETLTHLELRNVESGDVETL
jgi:hypothetical protein